MAFNKFTKEDWFKLTKEEQEFHTLEFKQDIEKRKKITLYSTRIISIFLILALVWMGFVQLEAIKNYDATIDKYGSLGHCYLCGLQNYRTTSCYYPSDEERQQITYKTFNYSAKGLEIAENNIKACPVSQSVAFGGLQIPQVEGIWNSSINISDF